MSKISDKLKTRALETAEKHLEEREGGILTNARANNDIKGVVAFLRASGYDPHIIESTLLDLGYDEGLISYHLLTPLKPPPNEIIGIGSGAGQGLSIDPNPPGDEALPPLSEPPQQAATPPLSQPPEEVPESLKQTVAELEAAGVGIGSEEQPPTEQGTPDE